MRRAICLLIALALCLIPTACVSSGQAAGEEAPGTVSGKTASGAHGAVSCGNPLASGIGVSVLKAGGNAVDAAVAVSFALGLVEPNASGVGGCGYLVYQPAGGEAVFYDYRSTAPVAFDPDTYCALSAEQQKNSIHAAGVPGAVAGWLAAHEKYGRLPLADLLAPAIELAETGFEVLPFLAGLFTDNYDKLSNEEGLASLLLNEGFPYAAGDTLVNPAYAKTLRLIAQKGAAGFYTGEVAKAIVATCSGLGGCITLEDLAGYRVRTGAPLSGSYRDLTILAAAPSSSGGVAVLQSLNMLESIGLTDTGPDSAENIHRMAEVFKLANFDRYTFVADPDFIQIPLDMLLSKSYAARRAAAISDAAALAESQLQFDEESTSTTHLSVIDAEGNAVSMTNTLGNYFGCGVAVEECGFLLDNQLHDFSVGEWPANAPQAGKRPRSSMCPVILLDENGDVVAALGTPGGEAIVTTVVQIICNLVDFSLPVDEAVNRPRIYQNCTGPLTLEGGIPQPAAEALASLGHETLYRSANDDFFGGVHAGVRAADGTLTAAADPRRDGAATAY
jgi:gamma-glutamyltranspeptidase/glutathione hydrolase